MPHGFLGGEGVLAKRVAPKLSWAQMFSNSLYASWWLCNVKSHWIEVRGREVGVGDTAMTRAPVFRNSPPEPTTVLVTMGTGAAFQLP